MAVMLVCHDLIVVMRCRQVACATQDRALTNIYIYICTYATQVNGCVTFSGSNYLQMSTSLDFGSSAYSEGLSFSAWFKFMGASNHHYSRIFDFGNGQASGNILISRFQTSSDLSVDVYGSGGDHTQATVTNAWPTGIQLT